MQLARQAVRPAGFILAVITTAVLIPAITKQWNDHPQELEVKTGVVKDLSESAATAISNARFLATSALPASSAAGVTCHGDNINSPAAKERCVKERRDEAEAITRTNMETHIGWRRASAALETRVAAYFEGEEVKWRDYSKAVELFLRMSTRECGSTRNENVRQLLVYLLGERTPAHPENSAEWGPLFNLTEAECKSGVARGAKEGYRKANGDLSDMLLSKRNDLLTSLRDADSEAFSSGLGDFIADAGLPLLFGTLVAGLLLAAYPVAALLRRRRFSGTSR